jgi:RNA polymerase sigma-70 factor (ECF subfamily)
MAAVVATAVIDLETARAYLEQRWPRDDWSPWSAAMVERHARRIVATPSHLEDVFLAWACLDQVSEAVAELDRLHIAPLAPAVRGIGIVDSDVEELLARARARLLVGDVTTEAGLLKYTGRGPVGGFVRTTILRLAIDQKRREPRTTDEIDRLADVVSSDPTVELMRKQYGGLVAEALRVAWKSLPTDDRLLISYQVFDGLTVDEIGRLLKVHRSTAARRCVTVRERLLVEIRRQLGAQLGAGSTTVDSIMRAVMTGLTGGLTFGSIASVEASARKPTRDE